ncbi:hypothetical protein WJX72_000226 [[Myrmecia] bisecta]|uniref:Uncharacterized protein n=1 Tax=[Myrmecia] bisecta TaxID=41462 RepID=A0AAW1Q5Q0_9CHLO
MVKRAGLAARWTGSFDQQSKQALQVHNVCKPLHNQSVTKIPGTGNLAQAPASEAEAPAQPVHTTLRTTSRRSKDLMKLETELAQLDTEAAAEQATLEFVRGQATNQGQDEQHRQQRRSDRKQWDPIPWWEGKTKAATEPKPAAAPPGSTTLADKPPKRKRGKENPVQAEQLANDASQESTQLPRASTVPAAKADAVPLAPASETTQASGAAGGHANPSPAGPTVQAPAAVPSAASGSARKRRKTKKVAAEPLPAKRPATEDGVEAAQVPGASTAPAGQPDADPLGPLAPADGGVAKPSSDCPSGQADAATAKKQKKNKKTKKRRNEKAAEPLPAENSAKDEGAEALPM